VSQVRALVAKLHRVAADHREAAEMIEHWLDTQTVAPKVADLVRMAEERKNRVQLPRCSICHGQRWVVIDESRGAGRCSCAKGLAIPGR